jgi:hypothetical protein
MLLAHDNCPELFDELSVRLAYPVYPRRHTFLYKEGLRYIARYCSPNFDDWNEEYISEEWAATRFATLPAHMTPHDFFKPDYLEDSQR